MDSAWLLPIVSAGLVLGLLVAALLIAWRRRLPPGFVGRVKADAALAMLRALLVLLAGLALWLGVNVARAAPPIDIVQAVAVGLVAIGGVAFVARVALYALRIKPQLDHLLAPVAPAFPAVDLGETGLDESGEARSREAGFLPRPDDSPGQSRPPHESSCWPS